MKKNKTNIAGLIIILLITSILAMSIGFALRSHVLVINGNTTMGSTPKWDIHFENINISTNISNDNIITPAGINNQSTYITYDVKLPSKGDYYSFTVDLANKGNLDGKIANIIMNGNNNYDKYLKYELFYVDTNNELLVGDTLLSGEIRKIKVRIENVCDLSPAEFNEMTFNMSLVIQYSQL
jgi:hypothetical protein